MIAAAISIAQPEILTKRTHARLVRDTLGYMATRHVRTTLGQNFKQSAATSAGGELGYRARNVQYLRRKQRKFGHQLPNVFTGRTKRHVRNSHSPGDVTKTQHRARLKIKLPFPAPAWQRRELGGVSAVSQAQLVGDGRRFYQEQANKPANQRQRRRRS